jgi:ribose transport system ATP-binding protein
MSSPPLLEVTRIRKEFPGVVALDGVSIRIDRAEVVAIVGENGAGKSTLMKLIAGVYQPDSGQIELDGTTRRFSGPHDAMMAGVSLIHQELNLAENLTVRDNLFLGRETTFAGPLKWIDHRNTDLVGGQLLDRVGLDRRNLNRLVGELPPGQKQLVEIARALGLNAKLLIMDEPTSSLTHRETSRLYEVIEALKAVGVSVLYISHRLAEVKRCCDRAIVLRDGKNAGQLAKHELTHDNLVRLMVGRDLKQYFPRTRTETAGRVVLELNQLLYANGPSHPAQLQVRAGEVLGMAGLIGAGRTELSEVVFGIRKRKSGQILLDGQPVAIASPTDAIRAGIVLVPEDRRQNGLVLEADVGSNLSLPNLDRLTFFRLVNVLQERKLHSESIARLRIRTPSASQAAGLLSGGNQQKIVFGKWLARNPKLLILDEPTRGVDVGAKSEIYALVDRLASEGVAVWMITSDLEELLGLSDRVVVLHEGRIAGELAREELDEETVMRLATGGER